MLKNQKWIKADFVTNHDVCPVFRKKFDAVSVKKATLEITAKGVYYAEINGKRVGDFVMAPGCTVYSKRILFQTYDITDLLSDGENVLDVTLSAGWYHGNLLKLHNEQARKKTWDAEIIALIRIEYTNGSFEHIGTDSSWLAGVGPVEFSDIYDGEIFNAVSSYRDFVPVSVDNEASTDVLFPQDGEIVCEHEEFVPVSIIKTPKGETVVDFGQNLTGYPVVTLDAKAGEMLSLSFAEILDKDGNFYNENYRSAKCYYKYICKNGRQTYKPRLTFYGFRYIRIDEFPSSAKLSEDCFKAVAVYSDIKKTGSLDSSNPMLNQLFSNIFWGQKDNYLDIPTDCPQRDERMGWTGDTEVFAKAASYNFDVEKFFTKWLRDCRADAEIFGNVGFFVPNVFESALISAAWSDAAVIVPWQMYLTYGNKELLKENIDLMVSHVEAIIKDSPEPDIWKKGPKSHCFGDWLGMDAEPGSYQGATRSDFIYAAFFAYDVSILIKALEALDMDASKYKEMYPRIKEKFIKEFPECKTQTECTLALHFGIADDMEKTAKQLADMVVSNGNKLQTGFVGTPFLLHALSDNGYTDVAYSLLLQTEYPSWLFSVKMGATTVWEHWDGINDKGEVWSKDMNSFNHYAYGAVADWVYEKAAGITPALPGFKKVRVAPNPDKRLDRLSVSIDTRNGLVSSEWHYEDGKPKYKITVPTDAVIVIDGREMSVEKGTYTF